MKYCTECGKELSSNSEICNNCGKRIIKEEEKSIKSDVGATSNNNSQSSGNGVAVAGFVISLLSFILCCGSISWLGLILSIIGVSNAKKVNEKNKGLAIAGIALGIIGTIIFALIIAIGVMVSSSPIDSIRENIGTSL